MGKKFTHVCSGATSLEHQQILAGREHCRRKQPINASLNLPEVVLFLQWAMSAKLEDNHCYWQTAYVG